MMDVRALAFDVFGTVVDFRSTIIDEGRAIEARTGVAVDWAELADRWRGRYAPNLARVTRGELPWTPLDALHRMALDDVLAELGGDALGEADRAEFNLVWHRLRPWPDSVAGLTALRRNHILTTMSNGNVALLVDMARNAGLPWDCVLSAELVQAYKPDPRTYQMVPRLLALRPDQVMMVAAHVQDLRAAAAEGLRTAFVPRPYEHGPATVLPGPEELAGIDVVADDLADLAVRLG
ncbi:MAG TPA: haloacid dehalogenase type II [Streptosporangiaceae bacterium]|jgi:2-haloacid dehalogenase